MTGSDSRDAADLELAESRWQSMRAQERADQLADHREDAERDARVADALAAALSNRPRD